MCFGGGFSQPCRRWSAGGFVVNFGSMAENFLLQNSELAVAGRPLDNTQVVLPRQRDLLVPESLMSDSDIRLSERATPSPEQVRAQKGPGKHVALLRSLLSTGKENLKGPVLVCNVTGYVEDVGSAVSWRKFIAKGNLFPFFGMPFLFSIVGCCRVL